MDWEVSSLQVVGIHLLGLGSDEMLQGFSVAVTVSQSKAQIQHSNTAFSISNTMSDSYIFVCNEDNCLYIQPVG